MFLFDENIILNPFSDLPFGVKGIGIFKEEKGVTIVCKKEEKEYLPIGLNDTCNGAYFRYGGEVAFTPNGKISCTQDIYLAKTEINLVIGVRGFDLESIRQSILYRLTGIYGLMLKKVIENKQQILHEEKMANNTFDLLKFVFDYQFDYLKPSCDVELVCNC